MDSQLYPIRSCYPEEFFKIQLPTINERSDDHDSQVYASKANHHTNNKLNTNKAITNKSVVECTIPPESLNVVSDLTVDDEDQCNVLDFINSSAYVELSNWERETRQHICEVKTCRHKKFRSLQGLKDHTKAKHGITAFSTLNDPNLGRRASHSKQSSLVVDSKPINCMYFDSCQFECCQLKNANFSQKYASLNSRAENDLKCRLCERTFQRLDDILSHMSTCPYNKIISYKRGLEVLDDKNPAANEVYLDKAQPIRQRTCQTIDKN